MKVGVFLGEQTAFEGGGYTFQDDILQSLIQLADESNHKYVIFCRSEYAKKISLKYPTKIIEFISYNKRNIVQRIITLLERVSPAFRIIFRKHPGRLDVLARKADIDVLWFVGAGCYFVDIPYITVVWDLMHRTEPWFKEVSMKGQWDFREEAHSWFLRRAYSVITGTQVGKGQLVHFYQIPPERIEILPHPTPLFSMEKSPSENLPCPTIDGIPSRYLFYPAQFWAHKNHANLLLALKILRDEFNLQLPLILTGADKGNLPYIKDLIRKYDLLSQVHLLGFVSQTVLRGLYENAVALTYVSFCGPENLPPLEAFALGCPVIAADIPGANEQLGSAVLYVDPKDPWDIAKAIKNIYDDAQLRNTLIQKGHKRALAWTGKDYVQGVFKILDGFENIRRSWK